MLLSRPQIIYCMLGINELERLDLIDSCAANSIINNLSLELLKMCDTLSDSIIDSLGSDETDKTVVDVDSISLDSLKRDPKSGWPDNAI